MATNVVNLDALIAREDFEIADEVVADVARPTTIRITDLAADAFFYSGLRKPDFQRETANWSPAKIQDFIQTFLDGDLIPSIIFWGAGGNNFVIDGAHRLSALAAWVHDDYGDGKKSREFFQNFIPAEQSSAAERTRKLINKSIGTFVAHQAAVKHPEQSDPELLKRAKRLGSALLQLQWVPTADAKKAEASFFKINQAATEIDPTELRILRARLSPNAVAARVIVRGATGHRYWANFSGEAQGEIEAIGKELYQELFHPPLVLPIKTLDLPVGGRGYSGRTLPLIFDLVSLANNLSIVDSAKLTKVEAALPVDEDGSETIKFLKNTRRLVRRITGTHPSSLGLHPAVYFYSADGRHQPTATLGLVSLIRELEQQEKFDTFARVRRDFEDFFIANKNFINQIQRKFGSGAKSFDWIKRLYRQALDGFWSGQRSDEVLEALRKDAGFAFLAAFDVSDVEAKPGKQFDRATKSAAFLREALANPVRCAICGAMVHMNSIHVDHVERRRDGGAGTLDNAQLSHPYCNSTYKQ
jgi:hypothetical protein